MNKQIAASILGLENKEVWVNKLIAKDINWIHYDVMDGIFVPKTSLPVEEIKFILKNTNNHIVDIHLMVSDPVKYLIALKGLYNYATFHFETESIDNIRKIFKNYGLSHNLGLAVKPKTNIEQIYEFIPDCSHILIMTVEPGKGGQMFNHEMLVKIKKLKAYLTKINNQKTFIQVDGGINDVTGKLVLDAGATNLVSGSFLIKNLNQPKIVQQILKKK